MITALKCSGRSHAFRCVVEKNKNVVHQPRSVRIGKNCALCLEYCPRPAVACVASVSSGREANPFFRPRENRASAKIHWSGEERRGERIASLSFSSPPLPLPIFFALALFSRGRKRSSLLARWKRLLRWLGRRPRVVSKTWGTVFPSTDLPAGE